MSHLPPTLLQLLLQKYQEQLQPKVSEDLLGAHLKHLQPFIDWAEAFLGVHRPNNVDYRHEHNLGIGLLGPEDRYHVLISPPIAPQPGVAGPPVPISGQTASQSEPGMRLSGWLPIDGKIPNSL